MTKKKLKITRPIISSLAKARCISENTIIEIPSSSYVNFKRASELAKYAQPPNAKRAKITSQAAPTRSTNH